MGLPIRGSASGSSTAVKSGECRVCASMPSVRFWAEDCHSQSVVADHHLRNFNARDQLGKRPSEANRQTFVDVSLRVVRSTLFFALLLEPYDLVIREAPILIRRRNGVSSTAKEFI